jgi:hypothetical protein
MQLAIDLFWALQKSLHLPYLTACSLKASTQAHSLG